MDVTKLFDVAGKTAVVTGGTGILGGETVLDVVIIDHDGGMGNSLILRGDGGATAPWQELGIIFNCIHQREHLARGITDQNRLFDVSHKIKINCPGPPGQH